MNFRPCSSHRGTGLANMARYFFPVAILGILGCSDLFNPSFLDNFAVPEGSGSNAFQAVEPPTGHIPILFKNSTRMSDEVFEFLIQGNTVVSQEIKDEVARLNPQFSADEIEETYLQPIIDKQPVDLEGLNTTPRVRLTIDVTNTNGGVQRLEFLDGLRLIRGENLLGGSQDGSDLPPDLLENSNNIFVVQCDIEEIRIVRIEVFVPVVVRELQTQIFNTGGVVNQVEVCVNRTPPRFSELEEDFGFDTFLGDFDILRNYDPRNFPPPLDNINCGAAVVIELIGDLSLPFEEVPEDCLPVENPPNGSLAPGYFSDFFLGIQQQEQIPGRYLVRVSVRDQ